MMAALPHKIALIALILWVSVVGCQGCETSPTSCESSYDCTASQVCVSGQCRQVCNYNSDCDVDERCFDGACAPDLIGHVDASMPTDAILIDHGASDLLHADLPQTPDTSSANDVVSTDVTPEDQGAAGDHDLADVVTAVDASSADRFGFDAALIDAVAADQYLNTPPNILSGEGDLWTYPSSAAQSYPVVVVLQVADIDDDGPYFFALADDSDPGCAIEEGTLVYTAPELFLGAATCGVHATDSGAPPATGPIRDFVISVRAPETSCWTLLNNSALADRAIGSDDGLYVIDPDGLGEEEPFTAYCDMSSDGGGWTLAMRGVGEEAMRYHDSFWTVASDTLSHEPDPSLGAGSEKYQPFNVMAFSELRVVMATYDNAGRLGLSHALQLNIPGASLLDTFQRDNFTSSPWAERDRSAWLTLVPTTSLQDNCNMQGLNVDPAGGERVRIGISSNSQEDCLTNDSSLGFGRRDFDSASTIGFGNNIDHQFVRAAGLVFVRDSAIKTQQRRSSCLVHRLAGEDQDGLYPIDPDDDDVNPAFVSYCDMQHDGGGWTLLATKGREGELDEGNLLDATPLGSPALDADFKSPAFAEYRLADVRFQSIDGEGDPAEYARYNGLGTPLSAPTELNDSFYSRFQRDNANGTNIGCMFDDPISYHMTAGQISGEYLCESTLFVNPRRTSKDNIIDCYSSNYGIGPSWSRGLYAQGGCPNHWAESGDLFGSDGFPNASPFADQPVQIWARDDDMTAFAAVSSCQMHYDAGQHISGRYTLSSDGGQTEFEAYCRMEQDGTAWMRVAYLDMGHQQDCPGDWQHSTTIRACVRDATNNGYDSISSAQFSTQGISYSQIKGFIHAYAYWSPDAFSQVYSPRDDIAGPYVDGISVTRGSQLGRQTHVWTLAASSNRVQPGNACPCAGGDPAPSFVGEHYDCDQGTADTNLDSRWYVDNPLFDGFNSGSCFASDDNGWFFRDLGETTQDDIELRLMADQEPNNEDIGVTAMELYVR